MRQGNQGATLAQYGYDGLNRLTQVMDGSTGTPIETYAYDATGNRTSLTNAGITTAYTYGPDSHRLDKVGNVARNYDAAGNTTKIGGNARQFVYDNSGRMTQVKSGGVITRQYAYNAKGEQTRAYLDADNAYFAYDEAGHLLGEYGGDGSPKQQFLWFGDLPVGVLQGSGANQRLHYIEPDHLGTPRAIIDGTRNVAIWEWKLAGEAFGATPPNKDPDQDGIAFNFDLRFPGQRYDAATELNYNYFRDYDPTSGRYVESDPIGLIGGISTFSYVASDPFGAFDSSGLQSNDEFWRAWDHYCNGNGSSWTIPINQINWGDAVRRAKDRIEGAISKRGCTPGSISIDEQVPAAAAGRYENVIGRHMLRSSGTLTTRCDCSYKYTGLISSALGYDPYDFNPSNRGIVGEIKTWIGRSRCPRSGVPFNIKLPGSISITLSGKSPGPEGQCCDVP